MRVFIANFGRSNFLWPECLSRGTVATLNDEKGFQLWQSNDRENYILNRIKQKTEFGIFPTRALASRWFNLMTIISQTNQDIWIHKANNELWWTTSLDKEPTFEQIDEPTFQYRKLTACHKQCQAWSNLNKKGNKLLWNALHPKAHDFLFTEATLQQLTPDNANYAQALLEGGDLSRWHLTARWRQKSEQSKGKKSPGFVYNSRQKTIYRLAQTAFATARNANGQIVSRRVKNKDCEFSSPLELEQYVAQLLNEQEGLCAISSIKMQFDGDCDDEELLCSLDRIDSDGPYAIDNLQIVCRFVNRWKSDDANDNFCRLLELIKTAI